MRSEITPLWHYDNPSRHRGNVIILLAVNA